MQRVQGKDKGGSHLAHELLLNCRQTAFTCSLEQVPQAASYRFRQVVRPALASACLCRAERVGCRSWKYVAAQSRPGSYTSVFKLTVDGLNGLHSVPD